LSDSLVKILTNLTGQEPSFPDRANRTTFPAGGLGYSQFNELLLLLGYDRVSDTFFQYLIDDTVAVTPHAAIKSEADLRTGVDRFRKLAILRFGNVKFGFKYFASPSTDLEAELAAVAPVDATEFENRHDALVLVKLIPGKKTYYLGYLVKQQLDKRLQDNPNDEDARQQLADREEIVKQGRENHDAYLVSDHLDVYVATSMREPHEFVMVHQVVKEVFESSALSKLNLRYFDPTQAYCDDRIDKGLAEGLMLKRAKCTLYLAQESDTLGKDSELASTLAQGKPVIAYIPRVTEAEAPEYVEKLVKAVRQEAPKDEEIKLVLQQLRVFDPTAAWSDKGVRTWLDDPSGVNIADAKARLAKRIREHYDGRAKTLKESHPLGIQVHLETGVANGVLVARTPVECAQLIRRILTRTLEFDIEEKGCDKNRCLLLKEKLTGSIFRVVTGDRFLTNAFWNFYLPR